MSDTKVKVGPYVVDEFLSADEYSADTNLNETDLNDGFLNQSGLAAYYGALLAKAQYQAAEFKLKRDVLSAKISSELRNNPPSDKKLTEKALDELVTADPRVQAIVMAYLKASEVESLLKAAVDAMKQRRDMIIQLGASEREDAKGEVRMKLRSASDRSVSLKERLART